MLFIVQFEDRPDVQEIRQKLFQSHLDFLEQLQRQGARARWLA
jgi:uncharacterized protein YciI